LLTGLFSFLTDLPKADKYLREKKQKILEVNFLQMRLQQTFSKCLFESDVEFQFAFSSEEKKLSYVLDLGIDRDPDFSGPVNAAIYIDQKNNLIINYSSTQDTKKEKYEILLKDVANIDFYFYDFENKKWQKNKLQKPDILPKMLKVIVNKHSTKIEFAYIFPQTEPIMIKS